MSAEVPANARSRRAHEIRARLQRFRSSRQNGMLGVAEIIALAGSGVIVLTVFLSYAYFLAPARSNLQRLQLERTRLQNQLRGLNDVTRSGQSTQASVDAIISSITDFEDRHLAERSRGRMGLYDELNQLIRKNGLRNTSGPSYSPLDPAGTKSSSSGSKSASTKWQSVYPGISVSVTVEGPYQNLRHFIQNLEVSNQFVIINAIELERATETNTPVSAEGAVNAGARSSLVSLRLDLATYFRRSDSESN